MLRHFVPFLEGIDNTCPLKIGRGDDRKHSFVQRLREEQEQKSVHFSFLFKILQQTQ